MDVIFGIVIVAGLAVLAWAAWTFNVLVRRRNGVDEGWSTIEVELRRRHDLVPQLVEAVRGYAGHERALFERVAEARSRAVAPQVDAVSESALTDAVRSLFAVAEAYPELRASENFQRLQQDLSTTEDRIAYARSYYNAWVTDYESARQSFPSMLIARLFRFGQREFFEAEVGARAPVAVELQA